MGKTTLSLLVALLVGAGVVWVGYVVTRPLSSLGIYGDPSGQACYIAGEACTINAPLAMPPEEIVALARWCADIHEDWQAKFKQEAP